MGVGTGDQNFHSESNTEVWGLSSNFYPPITALRELNDPQPYFGGENKRGAHRLDMKMAGVRNCSLLY